MESKGESCPVNVLVAYEDFASGTRAMGILKRIDNQCGQPGQLIHMMWRFDVVADADYFDHAVREALASDIIVIATREGKSLPQRIRDWIARWLLMKTERPLALVAALDYPPAKASKEVHVLPYLSKLAQYGKMEFFANGNGNAHGFDLPGIDATGP